MLMEATLNVNDVKHWKRYTKYRPSGAKWHTEVPSSWGVRRLKYLAEMNPSKSEVNHLPNGTEVSFLPMEQVGEDGSLSLDRVKPVEEVYQGFTYFRDGDVLVAKITPCFENGKGALAKGLKNGIGFGTTEFHVLRPNEEITGRYLELVTRLHPFRGQGISEFTGAAGQQRVPESFLNDYLAPLPPLPEQHAIAAFLDRETARIDALIGHKQRLIALLEEKRQAVISHAVTKGLDPNVKMKDSGKAWLGSVPTKWTLKPLKHCVSVFGGMTPSKENRDFWNGNIPWVSPKDMKRFEIDCSEDHITEAALEQTTIAYLPVNTVMIVIRGMILARHVPVAINTVRVTINQDMKALQCNSALQPRYLAYQLRAIQDAFFSVMEEAGHGTLCLRTELWNSITIAVPPNDEQQAICDAIDKSTATLLLCISQIHESISQLHEYRTALISAAVTGQIDVREEVQLDG